MEERVNKTKKLSYEELEHAAAELAERGNALYKENAALRDTCIKLSNDVSDRRVETLFKVVAHKDAFDAEFVNTCKELIKAYIASWTYSGDNKSPQGESKGETKGDKEE